MIDAPEERHKLGMLDQVFHAWETAGMAPTTIGGALVIDARRGRWPLDGDSVAAHVAARLSRIPALRRRLLRDPLGIGQLQLVDIPGFDARRHIRVTRVAAPGDHRALMRRLGGFIAAPVPLDRPLWHVEVITGLRGGRIAIALRMHHALFDGIAALHALDALWDTRPRRPETHADAQPHADVPPPPSPVTLLGAALLESAERLALRTPAFLWRAGVPLAQALGAAAWHAVAPGAARDADHVAVPAVRRTSINISRLSARRVVDCVELPLRDVRALARHYDCSVNDLVLLLNSCALEHYFRVIGETLEFELVVGIPVSLRNRQDTRGGNDVSAARLGMHNGIRDIEARLRAIVADTTRIKRALEPARRKGALVKPREVLELMHPLLLDALLRAVVRLHLQDHLTLFNVVITNVPGTPRRRYVAGARQVGVIPLAPVADTVGLNVCVTSSDTQLVMGFQGCARAVRDTGALVTGVRRAFRALKRRAGI